MNETLSEYYKNTFDHLLYLLPFRNAVILLRGNPAMQTSTFPTMCFSFFFALADNLNTNTDYMY